MRILIVDDDPSVRRMIVILLKHIGHTDVVEAETVHQALHMFDDKPADFIITDWNMPHLTGGDLIKIIRSTPEGKEIPILLMTGSNVPSETLRNLGLEESHYLDKPFGHEDFKAKVDTLVEKHYPT